MPFRDIFTSRVLVRPFQVRLENESPLSVELARELEDVRKMSLSLLVALLTVHAASPPSLLGTITLALLVYTINLHITINVGFLRHSPTLSRLLHALPLFGMLCMTVFQLVVVVHSPAVAAMVLFACALPPLMIWIYLARRYIGTILPSPVQMRDVAPAWPISTSSATVSSN